MRAYEGWPFAGAPDVFEVEDLPPVSMPELSMLLEIYLWGFTAEPLTERRLSVPTGMYKEEGLGIRKVGKKELRSLSAKALVASVEGRYHVSPSGLFVVERSMSDIDVSVALWNFRWDLPSGEGRLQEALDEVGEVRVSPRDLKRSISTTTDRWESLAVALLPGSYAMQVTDIRYQAIRSYGWETVFAIGDGEFTSFMSTRDSDALGRIDQRFLNLLARFDAPGWDWHGRYSGWKRRPDSPWYPFKRDVRDWAYTEDYHFDDWEHCKEFAEDFLAERVWSDSRRFSQMWKRAARYEYEGRETTGVVQVFRDELSGMLRPFKMTILEPDEHDIEDAGHYILGWDPKRSTLEIWCFDCHSMEQHGEPDDAMYIEETFEGGLVGYKAQFAQSLYFVFNRRYGVRELALPEPIVADLGTHTNSWETLASFRYFDAEEYIELSDGEVELSVPPGIMSHNFGFYSGEWRVEGLQLPCRLCRRTGTGTWALGYLFEIGWTPTGMPDPSHVMKVKQQDFEAFFRGYVAAAIEQVTMSAIVDLTKEAREFLRPRVKLLFTQMEAIGEVPDRARMFEAGWHSFIVALRKPDFDEYGVSPWWTVRLHNHMKSRTPYELVTAPTEANRLTVPELLPPPEVDEDYADEQWDYFWNGYMQAALRTGRVELVPGTDAGTLEDHGLDEDDIEEDTLDEMRYDADAFWEELHRTILAYGNASQAGHDFHLTRNRHGAGFWDGDWPEPAASQLTEGAHLFSTLELVSYDGETITHHRR